VERECGVLIKNSETSFFVKEVFIAVSWEEETPPDFERVE